MDRVASLHIVTFAKRRLLSRVLNIPADRWEMNDANGCVLAKVLGTSKRGTTKLSVDLGRWCLFAVWEDEAALQSFIQSSPVVDRWTRASASLDAYRLTPLSSRGTWSGIEPFPDLTPPDESDDRGQVAVITRARVRWSKLVTFNGAIAPVDDDLRKQDGCQLALGMGEWPIGEQATFSLWENDEAIRRFAYSGAAHKDVIKRTYREGWYSEELFARFRAETLV